MKKALCAVLALVLLALCACGGTEAAETSPEPTASQAPATALDIWALRVTARYNMEYDGFVEYWSMICDDYFGSDFKALLNILSGCENVAFPLSDKNAEIEKTRSEYDERFGSGWHFEYVGCETEALEERANQDFSAELENLYDRICVLTEEAEQWGDGSWASFAADLGCDVESAKEIVKLYKALAEMLHGAVVEDACSVRVTLRYEESEVYYDTWLYKVNGAYVSQELIDNTLALINLIY